MYLFDMESRIYLGSRELTKGIPIFLLNNPAQEGFCKESGAKEGPCVLGAKEGGIQDFSMAKGKSLSTLETWSG